MLTDEEGCVKIVELNEGQEATMEDLLDLPNTQYVLEVKTKKNKGKKLISQKKRQVTWMKKHPLYLWLESSWQSDVTIRVMKPWLTLMNKKSLETKNMKLYRTGQTITRIMKEFTAHLKDHKKPLNNVGFGLFEEWASEEGLSMMYGRLQTMDWAIDLNEQLFDQYSESIVELEKRQAELEEIDEPVYSSSASTRATCMSSTTVPTAAPTAGVSTYKDYENTLQKGTKSKNCGEKVKPAPSQKAKFPSKKRTHSSSESDSEDEETYKPGTLHKEFQASQQSVEDESEPDVDICPTTKKAKKSVKFQVPVKDPDTDNESDAEAINTEEGYVSMLANLQRAHSLVQSTGKISQNILVKDDDGFISITSPGERGYLHSYEARAIPIQRLRQVGEFTSSDLWAGLPCVQVSDGIESSNNKRSNENQGSQGRKTKQHPMEKWLESFIITPMKNILYSGHWTHGPYKYVSKKNQLLTSCFHNMQQRVVDMSYRELFLKTRIISMNKLIYAAPWNAVSEYYYDIYDSVQVLEELIKHQFCNDEDSIYNFFKNLYYLVDKKVPKKNCICIVGPSCSGKNFFFDCLIHSCINFGQIGNFNKYDRFPLQGALQRRILLWNGLNFEPGSEAILKYLFGGDTCSARIKYEGVACIFRTPIVVLTNRDVIPNDTIFTSRVWKYHWRVASFLKYLTKKPHPLSMFYLFFKYNILSKNNLKFDDWEQSVIKNK